MKDLTEVLVLILRVGGLFTSWDIGTCGILWALGLLWMLRYQ